MKRRRDQTTFHFTRCDAESLRSVKIEQCGAMSSLGS